MKKKLVKKPEVVEIERTEVVDQVITRCKSTKKRFSKYIDKALKILIKSEKIEENGGKLFIVLNDGRAYQLKLSKHRPTNSVQVRVINE